MSVESATAASRAASSASTDTNMSSAMQPSTLGTQFMNLLVTQLKNQDPMDPMDDREMIQQLTQLSSLDSLQKIEQLSEQNTLTSQITQAAALIGRTVTARNGDTTLSGQVTAASVQSDNQVQLTVAGKNIHLSDLLSVTNPA